MTTKQKRYWGRQPKNKFKMRSDEDIFKARNEVWKGQVGQFEEFITRQNDIQLELLTDIRKLLRRKK